VNSGLVNGTEFVDTEGAVGIEESGETAGSYYAVSSVSSEGDESAQSLGVSPATLSSSSNSGGGAGGAAGCFIDTVGQPVFGQALWFVVMLYIAVAAVVGIRRND
jgi:hypothetical protein